MSPRSRWLPSARGPDRWCHRSRRPGSTAPRVRWQRPPGQPSIERLRADYGLPGLPGVSRLFGVVGHPATHSVSPRFHNAGYRDVGEDGLYVAFDAPTFETFWSEVVRSDFFGRAGMPLACRGASSGPERRRAA